MDSHGEMGLLGENFDLGIIGRMRDDGYESRSGSDNLEGASGDDQDAGDDQPRKKKKYHRHTPNQIQELEAYDSYFAIPLFICYILIVIANVEYFVFAFLFLFFWCWVWCSFFKECPHPDEKQRLELSKRLGLETKQVKFWFQNRRTQMKVFCANFICKICMPSCVFDNCVISNGKMIL